MDPQTHNTWSPLVEKVEKGVSDLELDGGVMVEVVVDFPSGKDSQQNVVKENRKNIDRSGGVTSSDCRITFYALAFVFVFHNLVGSILVIWFDLCTDAGTLHKLLYVFLSAATIPYIGLLFVCLRKDVPVPSYRLGAERRSGIYLAIMVVIYCISYGVQDVEVIIEMSSLVTMTTIGVIAIVQLHSPAEDFDPCQNVFILFLVVFSSLLGWLAQESWMNLLLSLSMFIFATSLVKSYCLVADRRGL
ncbi:hypothetical protein CARUB_v10015976mg, partial [Capsella rubella]